MHYEPLGYGKAGRGLEIHCKSPGFFFLIGTVFSLSRTYRNFVILMHNIMQNIMQNSAIFNHSSDENCDFPQPFKSPNR